MSELHACALYITSAGLMLHTSVDVTADPCLCRGLHGRRRGLRGRVRRSRAHMRRVWLEWGHRSACSHDSLLVGYIMNRIWMHGVLVMVLDDVLDSWVPKRLVRYWQSVLGSGYRSERLGLLAERSVVGWRILLTGICAFGIGRQANRSRTVLG